MNTFLELVQHRYSCRSYSDLPVEDETVRRCIEAARLAPSACNSQPWRFIATKGPCRERLAELATDPLTRTNQFCKQAQVIIAVVIKRMNISAQIGSILKNKAYNLIDIGIAAEHICLQAADEGLGSCMVGWFNERKAAKLLGISKNERIALLVTLGYPAAQTAPPKKRKEIQEIVEHIETIT